MPSHLHRLASFLLWGIAVIYWGIVPESPAWIIVLLLLSPLVLMTLAEPLFEKRLPAGLLLWQLPAALSLVVALMLAPGFLAAFLAGPWLLFRSVIVLQVFSDWRQKHPTDIVEISFVMARLFPVVGALWLLSFCAGWNPLHFESLIVVLTGVHFHHAGFTLPLIAALCARHFPGCLGRMTCLAILIGVALVAVGITATQLHLPIWIEPTCVSVLVIGCLAVSWQLLWIAFRSMAGPKTSPLLFGRLACGLSGGCLLLAMLFAATYSLRATGLPIPWKPMPWMWAVHGSLNAFGFGLLGILGWRSLHSARADA